MKNNYLMMSVVAGSLLYAGDESPLLNAIKMDKQILQKTSLDIKAIEDALQKVSCSMPDAQTTLAIIQAKGDVLSTQTITQTLQDAVRIAPHIDIVDAIMKKRGADIDSAILEKEIAFINKRLKDPIWRIHYSYIYEQIKKPLADELRKRSLNAGNAQGT